VEAVNHENIPTQSQYSADMMHQIVFSVTQSDYD
jgi:hypothetical protein